jgi:hypothetical protein
MFHGGGPVFYGGGMRYGGIRYGGMRYGGMRYGGFGWHHHFHHRHFFFGGFYPYYGGYYPYYYPYRRCRIVWTYFGPRRVCRWPRLYPWAY